MKDLAKRAILASGALRLISPGASAAILMYHSVMPEPAVHADSLGGIIHAESEFCAQMELLARDYYPVSLDEVVDALNSRRDLASRSVVITFDDGYTDNSEVAMPILNRLGIPATFYVTVDCVEQRKLPWPSRLRFAFRKTKLRAWADCRGTSWQLDDPDSRERAYLASCHDCCQLTGKIQEDFVGSIEKQLQVAASGDLSSLMMSYDQIRGLARHGHIIGSHTMTHPNMAYIPEQDVKAELAESKQHLERELKATIKHFSYPCPALTPHWNEKTVAHSRSVGYESAVTTDGGVTRCGDDPLSLKRIRPTKTAEGLRWNLECAFAGRAV
ncbi:MAG TPA: polysaccharide deacetylase family protein [Candidatus Sulfotelmatobacter sp.]|nr:polysaccharide deacetylase family protein [Candidatus Sulfotelmatobacter sp.]